ALAAGERRERDLGEVERSRSADLGVSRDQVLLRGQDIGPALQEGRRKPGQKLRRNGDVFQLSASYLRRRRRALQEAELVFGLRDDTLGGGDARPCKVLQLLRLVDIEAGGRAALPAQLGDA